MHVGIYVIRPMARGAGPHYDVMSVFIRQLAGRKRWQVVKRCRPEMLDHRDGQPLANSVRQQGGR